MNRPVASRPVPSRPAWDYAVALLLPLLATMAILAARAVAGG